MRWFQWLGLALCVSSLFMTLTVGFVTDNPNTAGEILVASACGLSFAISYLGGLLLLLSR